MRRRNTTNHGGSNIARFRSRHLRTSTKALPKIVSHFLDLPAEIHLAVYEFAFASKLLYDNTNYYDLDNSDIFALLHACRVMRREATPIFYQTIRIELGQERSYQIMKNVLGEDTVNMVANVHFDRKTLCRIFRGVPCSPSIDRQGDLLELLPGLKVLILEDYTGWKRRTQNESSQVPLSDEERAQTHLQLVMQEWLPVLNRLEYCQRYQVFLHTNVLETKVLFLGLVYKEDVSELITLRSTQSNSVARTRSNVTYPSRKNLLDRIGTSKEGSYCWAEMERLGNGVEAREGFFESHN